MLLLLQSNSTSVLYSEEAPGEKFACGILPQTFFPEECYPEVFGAVCAALTNPGHDLALSVLRVHGWVRTTILLLPEA